LSAWFEKLSIVIPGFLPLFLLLFRWFSPIKTQFVSQDEHHRGRGDVLAALQELPIRWHPGTGSTWTYHEQAEFLLRYWGPLGNRGNLEDGYVINSYVINS
jgi:hypothetical protein